MESDNKTVISVCMGSSCFSRGNNESIELIKKYISDYNLSGKVILKGNLCHGNCSLGPNMSIGDDMYQGILPENIYDIMNSAFSSEVKE
ncbi:MAG TPA: (2Fe-2S) ferredoxin domain-containing protein [Spirochaetota bacterium]|nr:(2Fe-2S) ferredoxin domain-containing protein [Spirochaetota bacterium]HOH36840.1 (2Fe-2S) ferredoxin domain-containing protein [Spirochaetota bacterium]HPJ15017.1 (2Fe-2S) ferredoxin domain-containing protein [Spirochaetota bacterium]HPM34221.1 (2Fe-2S) ferredoxin domain-containing protein [Spirochaetota bacterium]HPW52129.1 (2Fe-2S) ferredoxin domain-containing protein [Spirochaetota bacterium]